MRPVSTFFNIQLSNSRPAPNPALALYRRNVVEYSDHVVCVRGETE